MVILVIIMAVALGLSIPSAVRADRAAARQRMEASCGN